MIYFLPLRSSKLLRTETPDPDDVVTSLAVSIFACFNTNVIVVLELLYLPYPKPKSVLPGSVGVPDPVLKLPIRYVLLNLASAPGKLNVRPAWVNDAQLVNNALVFVLSTPVIAIVINPLPIL